MLETCGWGREGRIFPRVVRRSIKRGSRWNAGWEGTPMLSVTKNDKETPADGESSCWMLDEIVRDGARRMLAAALEAEVAAYIEEHVDQVDEDGGRLVVRNGRAQPRQVLTSSGAIDVVAPRVNDTHRRGQRRTSAVRLGDLRAVVPQVTQDHRGVAAAVPARPVQPRPHAGVGAVFGHQPGPVRGHDHPADHDLAGRGQGLHRAGPIGGGLRVRVGRRDPL